MPDIEINAGEATASFGVANLHISEATLKFFGFYTLTLVGETRNPGHQKYCFFKEMMKRHERLV